MVQPETLKPVVIRETLSYKLDRTRARTEARHQPFIEKKPHPVGPVRPFKKIIIILKIILIFLARRASFVRGGLALHESF